MFMGVSRLEKNVCGRLFFRLPKFQLSESWNYGNVSFFLEVLPQTFYGRSGNECHHISSVVSSLFPVADHWQEC